MKSTGVWGGLAYQGAGFQGSLAYQVVGLPIAYIRVVIGVGRVPLAAPKHPALSLFLYSVPCCGSIHLVKILRSEASFLVLAKNPP